MYKVREHRYKRKIRRKKLLASILLLKVIEEDNKRERKMWVRDWIARRKEKGIHHNLFLELSLEDPNRFRRCLRMDTDTFERLSLKVAPLIKRQNTHLRESISASERLSVTLRRLATGETQESLSLAFRLGRSTISGIVREATHAIVSVLEDEFLRFPSTQEEWKVIAHEFGERWNFHHAIGSMDGKHCLIDPPLQSGSMFYNYKGAYSIVLLAVVDAQLRFIYVDVGTNGRVSDSDIWNKSSLKKNLENNSLSIPCASTLPGVEELFPYVVLGDEGFPLSEKVLIPYPGPQCTARRDRRIFNYRLSRARRTSENAFGVLGARFQVFRSPMRYDPDVARTIILATCCLHNFLRSQTLGRAMYTPPSFLDKENEVDGTLIQGDYRSEAAQAFRNLIHQGSNRHANHALALRDKWCMYFNTVGAVAWQDRMAT